MSDQNFPLDMPVQVYTGNGVTPISTLTAPWSTSLSTGDAAVLYRNASNNSPLGIYYKMQKANGLFEWTYLVPYSNVSEYVIDGGTVGIYVNLSSQVSVPSGSTVYYKGIGPMAGATIGPGEGPWAVISLNTGGGINNLGPQQANKVLAGPESGGSAVPTFRVLTEADTPYAAPLDSPTFTGTPQGTNATWPAPYDDQGNNGDYNPGGTSHLATRDLVKNAISGALGNFGGISYLSIDGTQLPTTGGGKLWVAGFTGQAISVNLPALTAQNYPDTSSAGVTFNFGNISLYPLTINVGQGGDVITWGGYNALTNILINPGETCGVTLVFLNGQRTWMVSNGTALPQADDTYTVVMGSGATTTVPVTAMAKKQIIMTGTLTAQFDSQGVEIPAILKLPNNGDWTVVNQTQTTTNATVLLVPVGGGLAITLMPGCNVHVVTNSQGIQTSSGSIGGSGYSLYVPLMGGNINLVDTQLLYDLLVITDNTQGNTTAPVVYKFDQNIIKLKSGTWKFFNYLQQPSAPAVSVIGWSGSAITVPQGQAVNVVLTPDGKLTQV